MELNTGFKQTELGSVPSDWDVHRLEEITKDMIQGVNTAIDIPEYVKDGIPMLKANNVIDQSVVFEGCDHISEATFNRYNERYKLKINDFLFSNIGARLGTGSLLKRNIKCSFAWNVLRIIPDQTKVDPAYLAHTINSPKISQSIKSQQAGSGMGFVPKGTMKEILVPLPSKKEQEVIANALSDADFYIESLEKLLAKKCLIKKGVMQELLTGKQRLEGYKKPWVTKKLSEIADIRSGGTPSTTQSQFWDGNILWCTPTDITQLNGRKFLNTTNRTITDLGLKNSSAEIIPANSIVMTSRATIGECAINIVPLTTNQGFKNFIPNSSSDVNFLYYLLSTQKQGFISLCAGSTFLEISKTQLSQYEVMIPDDIDEQKAIGEIIADLDSDIFMNEEKLEKARSVKEGMMQELLTGRIRLV